MQNKADISGCPVVTLEIEEATALGAAMLAGVGVGVYKNLSEAIQRVHKPGNLFEPNIKLVSFYTELFEIYREIYPALHRINNQVYSRFRV
jgi:xylulokinase